MLHHRKFKLQLIHLLVVMFITIGHNIGEKRLIFYPNWCKSNVTQIENITYGVVPKMLPTEAIGELLSTNTIKKVSKQYSQIL